MARAAVGVGCIGFILFFVGGCGSDLDAGRVVVEERLTVSRDVAVADATVMDVYAPSGAEGLPAIVMLHGTSDLGRGGLEPFARAVAERGAVVFVPDWKAIQARPEFPMVDDDLYRDQATAVVCSLRHVRLRAASYGADPARLTLLGHSGGGLAGARVALVDEPPWPGIDCDPDVSHRPDLFIGTAGDYFGWFQYANYAEGRFDRYDPFLLAGGNSGLEVRLLHGYNDVNVSAWASAQLHDRLVASGYDSRLVNVDAGHADLVRPDDPAGAFVIDQVAALLWMQPTVFDEAGWPAELRFDGAVCSYDGPTILPHGRRLDIDLVNVGPDPVLFLIYSVRDGTPIDDAIERSERRRVDERPPFVDSGAATIVAPSARGTTPWVFVTGRQPWILSCVPDTDPPFPTDSCPGPVWYVAVGCAPGVVGAVAPAVDVVRPAAAFEMATG